MDKILLKTHHFLQSLHQLGIPIIPRLIHKFIVRFLFGCQLGIGTKLGRGVILSYGGMGITIHDRAIIGDNVSIGSCVTIGGTSKIYDVPKIGNNSLISTGAKIIGPVVIGHNCVIGANAVVLSDIPPNSVAVGIPAKIIKSEININDYRDLSINQSHN